MLGWNFDVQMGNVTREPRLSYTPTQTAVVEFGIAVNRKWTGGDGQAKESVCFTECKAFGKMAETISKFVSKGNPLLVFGHLDLEAWETDGGQARSKHRLILEGFRFLADGRNNREPGQEG